MALVHSCTPRSACVALIGRREHTCSAAGECLAETAEEGGAEASTATEGQIGQVYFRECLLPVSHWNYIIT